MSAYAQALPRRIAGEAIGSLLLTATVVGSGIMAQRLCAGNLAIALLANSGSDGCGARDFDRAAGSHQRRALQSCGIHG